MGRAIWFSSGLFKDIPCWFDLCHGLSPSAGKAGQKHLSSRTESEQSPICSWALSQPWPLANVYVKGLRSSTRGVMHQQAQLCLATCSLHPEGVHTGHPKRSNVPAGFFLGGAASLCSALCRFRVAVAGWGQNCAKHCVNDRDSQVPVSAFGTVLFVSGAVSCDRKDHLIPKIRNPLVSHDNTELSSSHSCTASVSQLGRSMMRHSRRRV